MATKRRSIDAIISPLDDEPEPAEQQQPELSAPAAPRPTTSPARKRTPRATPQPADDLENSGENDRRLNVPLSERELQALQLARVKDRVPAAARVRAMIRLWETDEDVRARVDGMAQRGR